MSADILGYLHDKGLGPRRASGEEVHVPCIFCNEDAGRRGRLYVNVNPDAEIPGLHHCKLCDARGSLVSIQRFYGDATEEQEREDTGYLRRAILAEAATYYHQSLDDHVAALRWLVEERGLLSETIDAHQLGYANGGLFKHLRAGGHRIEDIAATGLTRIERESGRTVDFLNDHITIPYLVAGNVVMIRGRAFGEVEGGRKYVTPAGQKTRLFNTDLTWGADEIVVTEGEFDAMVLEQVGYKVVACPGANVWQDSWDGYFTETRRVWIVFDRDEAFTGEKGAQRVLDHLGPKARHVELPPHDHGKAKNDITEYMVVCDHTKADFDALLRASRGYLITVEDAIAEYEAQSRAEGLRFGIVSFDAVISPGLMPSQLMVILAKTGIGKGHPLDTEVPTPTGFRTWGDLQVDDEVFGSDGRPTKVTGIYDRGVLPTYRVGFSDGTSVLADPDHLWTVLYRSGKHREWTPKTMTTKELATGDLRYGKEWRFTIPMCRPVQYPERQLPIEPYTLGALIANGSMVGTGTVLSTPDDEVARRVAESYDIRPHVAPDGACPRYGIVGLIGILRSLGLAVHSRDKFIPEEYLLGSPEQRLLLLQGLMDGDGSRRSTWPGRSAQYFTTSPRLAKDVVRLVTSLGGTAVESWFAREGYSEGRVSVMMPSGVSSFLTARKGTPKKHTYATQPRRAVVSVEAAEPRRIRCITVDAADSLYLIGPHYIVTHNTLLLLNLFQRMTTVDPNIKILFVSLEQTRSDWWDRARRIYRFNNIGTTDEDAAFYWRERLWLDDRNRVTEEQLRSVIDDFTYETGAKPHLVAVDYLGYWARGFKGESYQRTGDAVMALKAVAKDLRVPIIAPHQVSRSITQGSAPNLDSARDSGVVEETADFVLSLWRIDHEFNKVGPAQTGETGVQILKSRHGGTSHKEILWFAPLTLNIIPSRENPGEQWVKNEWIWHGRGHYSWEEALLRHQTGAPVDMDFEKVEHLHYKQRQGRLGRVS